MAVALAMEAGSEGRTAAGWTGVSQAAATVAAGVEEAAAVEVPLVGGVPAAATGVTQAAAA